MYETPSISTDQIVAFVELAKQGSIRAASMQLHLSEQGVRSRLLSLERQLGVELYRKSRGIRLTSPLTSQGARFLPRAIAFLEDAAELTQSFSMGKETREVAIVASQYLATYLLIQGIRRFHRTYPNIRVRLSIRRESEVEAMMESRPEFQIGFAAAYEGSTALRYEQLFSMNWSVVTSRTHALTKRKVVRLKDLDNTPLIVYESGSSGRGHVIEAFARHHLRPRIEVEATTTDLLIRMAEAELGVAIAPLLEDGSVTRGRKVTVKTMGKQIRPIDSHILTRSNETLSDASVAFIKFIRNIVPKRST